MIYLAKVGDRGVRETEDTVDRVAAEAAREGSHGREVLLRDRDASDGDWRKVLSAPLNFNLRSQRKSVPLSV